MTVLEAIQRSTDFLTRKGVDSARLQAELLLAHVLQVKRMQLYLNFERALTDQEIVPYREFIRRRGEREPLQHIVGSANFCGLELEVNRHVLVPRPETEILAEKGWTFLNETFAKAGKSPTALDLATGSGCIAIALAWNCKAARLIATDISAQALEVARKNIEAHKLADRVTLLQGNAFDALQRDARFHLIVSNPPYIPSNEIEMLQPEVRDFDPPIALDGGTDGLAFYRIIAARGLALLEPGGKCMVEFGDGQAPALKEIFEKENWIVDATIEDYTHQPRVMIASATSQ